MAVGARRKLRGWGGLALGGSLMLALWVLVILVSAQPGLKMLWDFSPQGRFTVAPETQELLAKVRDDESLRLEVFTVYEPLRAGRDDAERQVLGILNQLQNLTTDLLRQYSYYGGASVQVVHLDPRRDPGKYASKVKGARRNSVILILVITDKEGKERERRKILSIDQDMAELDRGNLSPAPGARQRPPRLRAYTGEQAVSSAIKSLMVQGAPKVYLLTGHREADVQSADFMSYSELMLGLEGEGFQRVGQLNLETQEVPEDAEILASLEPTREFSEPEAKKLLAYLRRGGRVFLNVSYEAVPPEWNPTLENILAPLGLRLGTDLVCQPPQRKGASDPQQARQLLIRKLNPVHKITAGLRRDERYPAMVEAREIQALEPRPEGVNVDLSLLKTNMSWLAPRLGGEPDLRPPHDRGAYAERCVGAIVQVLNTADDTQRSGRLILVSGKTLINGFYRRQFDLALNIFQSLAERQALVTIRSEARESAVIMIRDPEERGERLWNIFYFLVAGVPLVMLVIGIGVLVARSRI